MRRAGDERIGARTSGENTRRGDGRWAYVYGIVPSDVETTPDARGVSDPPAEVLTVRYREVAALVSLIDPEKRLGTTQDMTAHAALLDAVVVHTPVLPLRFGAVMAGEVAVADELLAAHHDGFVAALEKLDGKADFLVKGRYERSAVLREIVTEDRKLARRRHTSRGKPAGKTYHERVATGQRITTAIAAKRDADTRAVLQALTDLGARVSVRAPTHHEDAVNLACLIDLVRQADLESSISRFGEQWSGRVSVRLLGPLAPYDFVAAQH